MGVIDSCMLNVLATHSSFCAFRILRTSHQDGSKMNVRLKPAQSFASRHELAAQRSAF